MARPITGCSTLRLQDDAAELENRASVLPPKEIGDIKGDEVITDYKPEQSDPNGEPAIQEKMNPNQNT